MKTFGIRMTGVGQGRQHQGFRDHPAAAGETDPVLRAIADGFIAAHATLCQAADELDKAVKRKAKAHPVARRLLFEAVSCLIRQVKRFSPLKSRAVRLSARRGFRKGAVATARKIAVLMLTL